jgi:predicted dinucleotide-binding enzyme
MEVGIIGSGQVAQALARGFAELGHDVKFGSRGPEKLSDLVDDLGGKASAGIGALEGAPPGAARDAVDRAGFQAGSWDHAFELLTR